jgi:ABC-type tungstate transport system substrate-binding protein
MLPEFFAFLGVDFFVVTSLATCLLEDDFPKGMPYLLQAAAIGGYVHILISKEFLAVFADQMRFWYCFLYLAVALANIIALNVYLAAVKKRWNLAKIFSGIVAFPALGVSVFFISTYVGPLMELYFLQVAMLFTAIVLALSLTIFSPKLLHSLRGGEKNE